ncbi:EAL domain-containing protein [Pelomonas sp. KK5]|uniref:two-component system response regulator n=1 Tax=Pelomonas sp. KK5 TaxID=1855730 RepID=UPI00097BF6E2|nr:EAL domain-containing protein [Pelomonas sp. KK5]
MPAEQAPAAPALRIQIVEDERIVALDLQLDLEQLGFEVAGIAGNVDDAVRMAAALQPDLVLMDIHLDGGGDGIDAARRIRAAQAMPVIFLTAYAEPEVLARAAQVAPYGYLLKPFELRELNATVRMAAVRHAEERRTVQAQRRLQLALESAQLTVLELDRRDGHLRWSGEPGASPALAELMRTERLGELLAGLDAPGRQAFLALQLQEQPIDLTCRWRDDGPAAAPRWLELHARPFPAEGLAMGMVRDVSARVESETRLRQALVVYESTSEAILFLDAQQRVLGCNPAFTRSTGWQEADVVGRRPVDFLYARRERRGGAGGHGGKVEVACWRADGSVFPALEHLCAVHDAGGRVSHHVLSFSDISEIRETQHLLRHQAMHDALTGLGNRLLLQEVLLARTATPHSAPCALLCIDLDGFKTINDTLGHDQGDELLVVIARRLGALLRRGDLAVRVGGDEFVVLMEQPRHADDPLLLARRLLDTIAEPVTLGGQPVSVGASIGVALYPEHATGPQELLKAADAAMYEAKARGRNRAALFAPALGEGALEQLRLEQGLRRALGVDQQLSLHWQPMVDMATGALLGAEALLRWRHPELGPIPPARFVPLAEATGLICPIGAWVLDRACAQAAAWLAAGIGLPRVAVNVSVRQFEQEDVLHLVRQALQRHGLPPERLEIEVTESLFGNADSVRQALQGLRELGVAVSLDDFGTGFSSLGQLRSLPIDRLKIDRSFVADLSSDARSHAVVRTVVTLARSLGLEITAEGVETEQQRRTLQDLGVHEAQGWLFHQAMPAEQLAVLLAALPPLEDAGAGALRTQW